MLKRWNQTKKQPTLPMEGAIIFRDIVGKLDVLDIENATGAAVGVGITSIG